ncbi:MAG TPA: HU family DNA-binding protein [Nocardioidaceae bacterium]|nr:HU family DNA-binding protein [Nocardioidaceae bacterium]
MNKKELVDAFIEQTGWSRRESEQALSTVLNTISDAVAGGEKVTLPGFGTFEKRDRSARTARNPQTGEAIKIKKTSVPAFRAGTAFKSYVAMTKKDQKAHRRARG